MLLFGVGQNIRPSLSIFGLYSTFVDKFIHLGLTFVLFFIFFFLPSFLVLSFYCIRIGLPFFFFFFFFEVVYVVVWPTLSCVMVYKEIFIFIFVWKVFFFFFTEMVVVLGCFRPICMCLVFPGGGGIFSFHVVDCVWGLCLLSLSCETIPTGGGFCWPGRFVNSHTRPCGLLTGCTKTKQETDKHTDLELQNSGGWSLALLSILGVFVMANARTVLRSYQKCWLISVLTPCSESHSQLTLCSFAPSSCLTGFRWHSSLRGLRTKIDKERSSGHFGAASKMPEIRSPPWSPIHEHTHTQRLHIHI